MASVETALRALLIAAPGVGAAVQGANNQYRIRPMRSQPNAEFPHITYQRISAIRPLTHSGSTRTGRPRFQIDVWSRTYEQARQLAQAIVNHLHGFKGTVDGIWLMAVWNDNDVDAQEVTSGNYRAILDFFIWHREA